MKRNIAIIAIALGLAGCSTNPYAPGPRAGFAVGNAAGNVVGNITGFGVGLVSGTLGATADVIDSSYEGIRTWHTEVTSDGRTIYAPCDTCGHPIY